MICDLCTVTIDTTVRYITKVTNCFTMITVYYNRQNILSLLSWYYEQLFHTKIVMLIISLNSCYLRITLYIHYFPTWKNLLFYDNYIMKSAYIVFLEKLRLKPTNFTNYKQVIPKCTSRYCKINLVYNLFKYGVSVYNMN